MLDTGNIDRNSPSSILEEMERDEAGTRVNVFSAISIGLVNAVKANSFPN